MMNRIPTQSVLILGGTTEARLFAKAISDRPALDITISLAGRTRNPVAQPVPVRTGGFGGKDGLVRYLTDCKIDILIDATHPFAQVISANAYAAAKQLGIKYFTIRRPQWTQVSGDDWCDAQTVEDAIGLVGPAPRRILVALGRQEVAPLLKAPQHHYIIRSIDPISPPLDLPNITYILARGPFAEADEVALLDKHNIDLIIAKNSGGAATYSKLAAARSLSIPVTLIMRPPVPGGTNAVDVAHALELLDHLTSPGTSPGTGPE